MIKTFKGEIKDNEVLTIRLRTNKGETGYKIKKLELFPTQPGIANVENVVQVFTVPYTETNTSATPNFDNPTLIGAAYFQDNASSAVPSSKVVVVDNVTFNQDIYITHRDISNSTPGSGTAVNYYVELDQMKLNIGESTVATLKDMRGRE